MNRWLYFIPVIVLLGIGALFVFGLKNSGNDALPSQLIGQPMPVLPQTALEGFDAGDLDEIIASHPLTLVNFWASWCGPCRAEHPSLIAIGAQGIPIVGVNYKDKPENAADFIRELGNPYAMIRTDETGRAGIDWGVAGVPETFFVNSEGVVVKRFFGPITERAMQDDVQPFIDENS